MRIPLATDIKTRTGAPDKDARQKNSYIEVKGEQSIVRKRPSAQGGISVGTGTAQGGYGLVLFWADTAYPITSSTLTTCNNATSYVKGDHVTVDAVDYWATGSTSNTCPVGGVAGANWSTTYVPAEGSATTWTNYSVTQTPTTSANHPMIWDGTKYMYRVFDGITTDFIYTSTSGTSWSSASSGEFGFANASLAKGNSNYVATEGLVGGVSYYSRSADGITWATFDALGSYQLDDVVWNGSNYVTVSANASMVSSDGITWTEHIITGTTMVGTAKITWNGAVHCVTAPNSSKVYISANGSTWSSVNLPFARIWKRITNNGSIICISSTDGKVCTSSDNGSTWNEITVAAVELSITGGNGKFIATKYNTLTDEYYHSTDGISWTLSYFKTAGAWMAGVNANSKFIAYDYSNNLIAVSSTGL